MNVREEVGMAKNVKFRRLSAGLMKVLHGGKTIWGKFDWDSKNKVETWTPSKTSDRKRGKDWKIVKP